MTREYGTFDLTIGVPNDYDGHRCEYAREYLREHFSQNLVDALVIQRTIPTEPVDAEDGKEYYRVGGNITVDRVSEND